MIFGRLSKGTGNALFSRVHTAPHPGRDAVPFYIISCFCTYYDEKMGYKMGYRAKGCGVQIFIALALLTVLNNIADTVNTFLHFLIPYMSGSIENKHLIQSKDLIGAYVTIGFKGTG